MAISPITLGDTQSRAKLNAAITEVNRFSATSAKMESDFAIERLTRQAEIATKAGRLAAANGTLSPGDVREFWTGDVAVAEPASTIAESLINFGPDGYIVRITDPRVIGPAALHRVEPGRRYRFRYAVRRHINSPDPANDAVRMALRWFDQTKAALAVSVVTDLTTLQVGDGRQERAVVVSRSAGDAVDIVAPDNARYVRPYVQFYGLGGATDLEVIEFQDVTDVQIYAPDVSDLAAEVDAIKGLDLGSRMETVEAAVTAPTSMTFLTTGGLAAATIPASVQIVRLLSGAVEGDGRGSVFQRVVGPADIQSVDGAWWERRPDLFDVGRPQLISAPDAAKLAARAFVHALTLSPSRHMRRFLDNPRPVVVLTGDSLSTIGVISTDNRTDSLWALIIRALREAYPEKDITFVNRGIGTQRVHDLNGKPGAGTIPSDITWYTDLDKPWLDYIKELQPDLVLLNFGMNDGGTTWAAGNFNQASFFSVNNKMQAWPKAPGVIWLTNIKPTTDPAQPTYSSTAAQEGRDAVAGFIRSYAQLAAGSLKPVGFVDVNRWFNVLRDGRDVAQCGMKTAEWDINSALPYLPAVDVRDYSLRAYFSSIAAGFFNIDGVDGSPLRYRLSPKAENVLFVRDSGGFLKVDIFVDTGVLFYSRVTNIPTPTMGPLDLRFQLSGNTASLSVNAQTVFDGPVIRYGGTFNPNLAYFGGATGDSGRFFLLSGEEPAYVPGLTDEEIYNSESGNNINHPCGRASSMIFAPAIRAQNWRAEAPSTASGAAASRLLIDPECIAIDFERRDYIIRSALNPALNAQGNPLDIITAGAGTKAYSVDPTTGVTLGLAVAAASQLYIPMTLLPAFSSECTIIVEAYKETAGTTAIFAALGPDAANGPRIQVVGNASDTFGGQVVDNSSSTVASVSVTIPSVKAFSRFAFSCAANDFEAVGNGLPAAADRAGSMPTGLTRLKLGYAGASASADVTIRKLIIGMRKQGLQRMTALTI